MATPAQATFNQAGLSGAFDKNKFNAQFYAVHQGDIEPLRPRAQVTPDMTLAVQAATVQGFYRQVYYNGAQSTYAGGNSPAFTAPTGNPRIDLLYLNSSGVLTILQGTEAVSPTPPTYPTIGPNLPICEVYHRVGETKIVNFEDNGANPAQGYIYRDVRPWVTIPGASTLGDVFRSGDLLLSSNTSAPTGFTDESATYNNQFIRISSGTPLTTGGADTHSHGAGTYAGPSHSHGGADGNTTLSVSQMPSHSHRIACRGAGGTISGSLSTDDADPPDGDEKWSTSVAEATGGGGSHNHSISADGSGAVTGTSASASHVPAYVQVKIYKKT